jgi:hypothetical protein
MMMKILLITTSAFFWALGITSVASSSAAAGDGVDSSMGELTVIPKEQQSVVDLEVEDATDSSGIMLHTEMKYHLESDTCGTYPCDVKLTQSLGQLAMNFSEGYSVSFSTMSDFSCDCPWWLSWMRLCQEKSCTDTTMRFDVFTNEAMGVWIHRIQMDFADTVAHSEECTCNSGSIALTWTKPPHACTDIAKAHFQVVLVDEDEDEDGEDDHTFDAAYEIFVTALFDALKSHGFDEEVMSADVGMGPCDDGEAEFSVVEGSALSGDDGDDEYSDDQTCTDVTMEMFTGVDGSGSLATVIVLETLKSIRSDWFQIVLLEE